MDSWESLIDKKIREAMEAGKFDDLAGAGQPIDLSENPFEDPDWRTAHRLMRNAGFAPSWIEERKDIDAELEAARIVLARNLTIFNNARGTRHEQTAAERWQEAESRFRDAVSKLNRRVNAWNLKTPALAFHRKRIDIEQEINRIKN
ncbi:MAG TPA: DnaJ family domain-containing protein [Chthoniobacterales bacterium]